MKKIILLNGGRETRTTFAAGLSSAVFEAHRSKEMIAHVHGSDVRFIHNGAEVDFADAYVFTRLRATDAHFCGILYEHLEAAGIPFSDPINLSFGDSEEKIAQMPRLARNGIRVPETIIAREESYANNREYIIEHMAFPLVYKTNGSQGRNVFKIDTLEALEAKLAEKRPHELFLLQEIIPNTFDTRTLVAYGEILGSIKRTRQKDAFLNNVAQGASVEACDLSSEEAAIAVKATVVSRIDFGGVDIIHTPEGPIVLEVNKSPQIKGFERVHGKDSVFKRIASTIEKRF